MRRNARAPGGGWGPHPGAPPEAFDTALVVLALASVGLWLAAILANHGDGIDYANLPDWSLVVVRRYGFVPSVAVLMVFAVALGRAARIRPVLARTAGACLLILVIASGWDAPFTRNGLTPWPTRAEIADQCQGSSTRVLKVPIAPEGWIARVPCHLA